MRIALLLLIARAAIAADPLSAAAPPLTDAPLRATIHITSQDAMDPRQTGLFESSLLYELGKRVGVVPVSRPPLPARSAAEQCPERQTSCLTRLAEGLGADEVVAAHAAKLDGTLVLTLKRIHIQSAEIRGSVTRRLTASGGEALLMVLGDVVDELYPDHARVEHLAAGVPVSVIARWELPPVRPWAVWTGTALAVGSLATGIVFGVLANNSQAEFDELASSSGSIPGAELIRLQDEANSRATTANAFYITSAVVGAGSILLALFADWGSDEAALREISP